MLGVLWMDNSYDNLQVIIKAIREAVHVPTNEKCN